MHDTAIDLATALNAVVMVVNIGLLLTNLWVLSALNQLGIALTDRLSMGQLPGVGLRKNLIKTGSKSSPASSENSSDDRKPRVIRNDERAIVEKERVQSAKTKLENDELGDYE